MPLTRSVPDVGCWRSAITRSIVVLPQPEGPMKETNSPSATCKLTLENASICPSAGSKVSETLRTSTARRFVEEINSAPASAVLLVAAGSIGENASRSTRHSVPSGSSSFNAPPSCRAMGKYWQIEPRLARSMFAQPKIFWWASMALRLAQNDRKPRLPGVLASTAVPREAVSHLEGGSVGSAVEPNRPDPGARPDAWAGEPVLRG